MNNSLYLFDFDGVICDSNKEVFKTSLMAYLRITESIGLSQKFINSKSIYDLFIKYRYTARISTDFLYLWNLISTKNSNLPSIKSTINEITLKKYKKLFFETREISKKDNFQNWLKLHKIYNGIPELIKRLNLNDQLLIASAKDETSISNILNYYNINVNINNIYGSENFSDKDEIFVTIKNKYKKRNIFFLDDMIENLTIAKKFKIKCMFASWGYAANTELLDADFIQIELSNLNKILDQ